MFTVCPKCTLTLVVTTVDLRAGQGYVRCGRCANVFNALIALREGDPNTGVSDTAKRRLLETAPAPNVTPAHGAGVAMEPEPETEPDPEPELEPQPEPESEIEVEAVHEEPETGSQDSEISLEFDAAATDVSDIFIAPSDAEHDTSSGNYEAVVLSEEPEAETPEGTVAESGEHAALEHTDSFVSDEWSLIDDEPHVEEQAADSESVIEESPLAGEPEAAPTTQPDEPWVQEMFAEAVAVAEAKRAHEPAPAHPDFAEPEPESDPRPAIDAAALLTAPKRHRPAWQPITALAALALLLAIQVVHFNRQGLVLNTTVGPLVSKVYGWFGVALTPRRDLTAYSVKQLGAEAEGGNGDRLRVRLSVHNESVRVQPLPLLRLTLRDRYGNAVATRDLEPADYLPKRATSPERVLEPDQRIDAELHVIDPSKTASSFEIDACLRAATGTIGCANDAPARSAS